jgi:hypothetical protein
VGLGELEMSAKNAGNKAKTTRYVRPERASFVGYVNITLTAEDAEDFQGWFNESEIVADAYLDAFDKGYQLTLKFDPTNECYNCSISNWNVDAPDSGVIYTAKSGTVEGAQWKAIYVWDRKLDRNLNNGAVKGTRVDAF